MNIDVNKLLDWYLQNKRCLPWRVDKNPYHVWVSEIMLQQTRIEAVISYYQRFMKELPTIKDLAGCSTDRLLKLWQGLGYYNRVKNLQKAAQIIVEQHKEIFPNTYHQILALPGIGEYTASAISSICFSEKQATVDGNVLRVYMRVCNCYDNIDDVKTRKRVRTELIKIMPADAGNFNEAMMELGETICIPNGVPKCDICPIKNCCESNKKKTYLDLPVRCSRKEKKEEDYTIFLFLIHGKVGISKRKDSGLLSNLWQFPNILGKMNLVEVEKYLTNRHVNYSSVHEAINYIHVFTHRKWNMNSYLVYLDCEMVEDNIQWVTLAELNRIYAIPTAFQPLKKYLEIEVFKNDET